MKLVANVIISIKCIQICLHVCTENFVEFYYICLTNVNNSLFLITVLHSSILIRNSHEVSDYVR